MRGATQIVQTPDFCVFTKTPLLPCFCCLVRNRKVEGKGSEEICNPPHVQLKAGEGALTDFVPLLCPKFLFHVFFCLSCDYFMLEKKHNRVTREKTGHGKTGYFHGNDYERKQHYIHLENQRSLVKSVHFLSVGNLVLSSDVLHRLHPLSSSYACNMNFASSEERPVSSSSFSSVLRKPSQCQNLMMNLQSIITNSVYTECLYVACRHRFRGRRP